jgi:fumarate reductase iron-sulfur subunit
MSEHAAAAVDTLEVHVWRGDDGGGFEVYEVPATSNQTILDVVTWIQRHCEPALAYRFACRVGVCGSCAMTVNGRPRWTCRSHVKNVVDGRRIVIEPLRNLPRVKDLVTDLTPFFEKWSGAGGSFEGTSTRHDAFATVSPASAERQAADAGIECINCAVCYSACDVVGWRPDYKGPAALNRAWTLVNDVRHAKRAEVFDTATADGGCLSCHTHGSCTEFCPVGISPTAAIGGLKRLALRRFRRGGDL